MCLSVCLLLNMYMLYIEIVGLYIKKRFTVMHGCIFNLKNMINLRNIIDLTNIIDGVNVINLINITAL